MAKKAKKQLQQKYRTTREINKLANKALGLCHCRRPASPRAKKSKLCDFHLNYQRDIMRKRLGVKKPQRTHDEWLQVDWKLKTPLLAKMLGCTEATIEKKRLIFTPAYIRCQPRRD